MDLIEVLKKAVDPSREDDLVDRFNHIYTGILLVLFAVIVTTEQYVGSPIKCWTPPQFTESFNSYTQKICWVQNTYRIPFSRKIPETEHFIDKPQILYYQWAPFIFLAFALLYQFPYIFWRSAISSSSLSLKTVVDLADKYHNEHDNDKKDEQIKILTTLFTSHFSRNTDRFSTLIAFSFVIAKLLYILNAVAQLCLTDLLLSGGRLDLVGFKLASRIFSHNSSLYFPRVGLCDFHIRSVGNDRRSHRYTVQCVLPINLYLEVIFLFYWYWLCFVILLNLRSFVTWVYYTLSAHGKRIYIVTKIRRELIACGPTFGGLRVVTRFVNNYLRSDGVFLVRLVSQNVSDLVASEIVSCLFENYKISERLDSLNIN